FRSSPDVGNEAATDDGQRSQQDRGGVCPGVPAPDLILLDLQMKGTNGLEGIALLQERWSSARVVIVSAFDRDQCARRSSAVRWSFTL
ncbi:DNA-binding response regulator CorR, partial [Pseudomonas syringae pv. actinidiae ICMP 19073]